MTEKKNPDYTASAVNLCNPPEVFELLSGLVTFQAAKTLAQAELEETSQWRKVATLDAEIAALRKSIEREIDQKGSYQDVLLGVYALRQRRISLTYSPACFRERFPQLAPIVIIEQVDQKKLDGLLKGGIVKPEELDSLSGTERKESFAYIIR